MLLTNNLATTVILSQPGHPRAPSEFPSMPTPCTTNPILITTRGRVCPFPPTFVTIFPARCRPALRSILPLRRFSFWKVLNECPLTAPLFDLSGLACTRPSPHHPHDISISPLTVLYYTCSKRELRWCRSMVIYLR